MPPLLAQTADESRWRSAIEAGQFGVWDLNPLLDLVHYSPQWKAHFGFPQVFAADSTSFWRCRVHPDDRDAMLVALREHFEGYSATYEMRFRLRSNGSGYRTVLSRGRVVERDHRGDVLRMIGTMVDLTGSLATPASEALASEVVPEPVAAPSARSPFHQALGVAVSPPWLQPGAAIPNLHDKALYLGVLSDLLDLAQREAA